MLKYTTAVNEDGIVSPSHNAELDFIRNTFNYSAGSKGPPKMAIKRRGKKLINSDMRHHENPYLPPISQTSSPQNITVHNNMVMSERRGADSGHHHTVKRREIRTPYVSHMAVNRSNDVVTPYVLHTQVSNMDHSNNSNNVLNREHSKLSGNVVELKHDLDLRHESTFTSLQRIQTNNSPGNDKRPRGRHGRHKSSSFNENDITRGDIRELTIQSNQMGLSKRTDRRRETTKEKGSEAISIRKKIEQFRRWHEEQYKEKIKKLKQEVDHQFEAEHTKIGRQLGVTRETPTSKHQSAHHEEIDRQEKNPSEPSHEKMDDEKATPNLSNTNETLRDRTESARTWHTWRDANDSYAYNDVHKYIKENELMDEEKASWIKKWVIEVNKAMRDQQETIL